MADQTKMWPDSYRQMVDRNIGLLTVEEQQRLRESKVCVLGLGGLGGVAFEVLVRCGIGTFSVVDKDTFEASNLNRQLLAVNETLGRRKIDVAVERAKAINPDVVVETAETVTRQNVDHLLAGAAAAVMAIDQLPPCLLVSRAARRLGVPLVEGWAIPFANVRTFTGETPTLEECYGLPTIGRELETITVDELKQCQMKVLFGLGRFDGVNDYYDEAAVEQIKQGRLTSFAPMVWLTAVLMAVETTKVLLGWGDLALAPEVALYDPFRNLIPALKTRGG